MFLRKRAQSSNCDHCEKRTMYVVFHHGQRQQFCAEHYLIHRRDSKAETGAPETRGA